MDLNKISTDTLKAIIQEREESVEKTKNRAVVVVDRGWIWAGDVTEQDGKIRLDNAVWVFRWESIGFVGVLDNPDKADIRPCEHPVEIPNQSEIFRIPVKDGWGL